MTDPTKLDPRMFKILAAAIQGTRSPLKPPPPDQWKSWLRTMFPGWVSRGFARYHEEFWIWLWAIDVLVRPRPFVGIWPRGGGKSTSAELGTTTLGVRGKRRYAIYVRANQEQADKSVSNIAALLESDAVQTHYPLHADRALGKFGGSKGWRRNRLVTNGGFLVDAVGLDTAVRGLKFEDQRPDLIILDDVDGKHDTPQATKKKLDTIRTSILPAGSPNRAILAVQNKIIPHGVFSQLSDGRADFLLRRIVSGPYPAVDELKTERYFDEEIGRNMDRITGGSATWAGLSLEDCQREIDDIGLPSFLQECQHLVDEREGALWTKDVLNETRVQEAPKFRRYAVGVDPSGGAAEIGIVGVGLGHDGHVYVTRDHTQPGAKGPLNWGRAAVLVYDEEQGDIIVGEANFGGDMVVSNIEVAAGPDRRVNVDKVNASRGKAQRAEPVASLWGSGEAHLVGTFPELEAEMTGWVPGDKDSPNRLDALVWAITELVLKPQPQAWVYFPSMDGDDEEEEDEAA